MTDTTTLYDTVEGYFGRLSYAPGDVATLHTSAHCSSYDVVIRRAGADPTEVWRRVAVPGVFHDAPADADANGCNWPVAVEVPIGEWPSGFYLVELIASDGPADRRTGYAAFIVRPAPSLARSGRALLVVATNTYHAYNNWGGVSLYTGGHRVSFRRPFGRGLLHRPVDENDERHGRDARKARTVRFGEQPDVDGELYQAYRWAEGYPGFMSSAGWFTYERRFVEWAERAGLTLDFAASSDLAEFRELLDGYALVLSIGHDEYWSLGQRRALERYVAGGGNVASFSGNTMFWKVALDGADEAGVVSNPTGYECRKYGAHRRASATGHAMTTGMWADVDIAQPEWSLLGAGSAYGLYARFGQATPRGSGAFTVHRPEHWMFEGTGLRYGDLLGSDDGIVGYETVGAPITLDEFHRPVLRAQRNFPDPASVEIVAFTASSNLAMGDYPKSIAALDDQGDLEFVAERVFGGLTEDNLLRARNGTAVLQVVRPFDGGGEVVVAGTTDWVYGLGDPLVSKVTRNIVDRYL